MAQQRKLAKFEKVSEARYVADCPKLDNASVVWQNVLLPKRATKCSAGYDFFAPYDIVLEAGETVTVATAIRALMPCDWVLLIVPRSGLGFKYRLRLNNTVGVIDADYSDSANEGHIFVRMTNEGNEQLTIKSGTAFAQGVFVRYGLTEDDDVVAERNGGLGSTGM